MEDTTAIGVGVVIVSHDSAADLGVCLEALAAAQRIARVVVVDNASADDSTEIVRTFPDVTLVEPDCNLGFAGGCNLGLTALPDEITIVAFMNPDVVVDADCLAGAAETLEQRPDLGGVAPLLVRPDRRTIDSSGQVLRPFNLEVGDLGYGEAFEETVLAPRPVLAACGALAVFQRAALAAVADEHGPWEQSFFCFWEDLELGWRLNNSGFPIASVPSAVAVHRRGAGAAPGSGPLRWRRPPELEACILSNRWATLLRHLHPLDLLWRFPLLLIWDLLLVAASVARRPRLLGPLLRRLPIVLRSRRRPPHYQRRRLADLP